MQLVESGKSPYYLFEQLSSFNDISHFVTTRRGGVSSPPYESLNIGFGTNDDPAQVLENRKIMAQSVQIPLESFVMLNQVHKTRVEIVTTEMKSMGAFSRESAISGTDAMLTNETGVCLYVMAADCVPILFFDPVKMVIGACHAGWRGTVDKAAVATVHKMETVFGCKPADIRAAIGPSIGPCCYNIGGEVIDAVHRSFGTTDKFIKFDEYDSMPYFNLWYANHMQLLEAGLKDENIELAELCTNCHADVFFSSRNGKGITGRFGAGIMII